MLQITGNRAKGKAIGRGRGAPAPIYAPPPGPSSQYQESHKKKLFMYNPEPITGLYHMSKIIFIL